MVPFLWKVEDEIKSFIVIYILIPLFLPFFIIGDVSNQIFLMEILFNDNVGKKIYTSLMTKFSPSCGKVSYLTLFLV